VWTSSAGAGISEFIYSAIHKEKQPHEYAISWTIFRSHGADSGGHFFNAKYGIRVQGAPDTAIIWRPADCHGTSLQLYDPLTEVVPEFRQSGLALVTSNRITSVWKKYVANQISSSDAGLECLMAHEKESQPSSAAEKVAKAKRSRGVQKASHYSHIGTSAVQATTRRRSTRLLLKAANSR
jgi:hypothetical protein